VALCQHDQHQLLGARQLLADCPCKCGPAHTKPPEIKNPLLKSSAVLMSASEMAAPVPAAA
jgi:hypothetical protein